MKNDSFKYRVNPRFLHLWRVTHIVCPEYLEKAGFIEHGVNRHDFEIDKFNLKKSSFGVIVFESDQDLSCEEIYRCYSERWELETMFDMYRHDEDLTVTAVQNDFSVRGSEFIDLISTIITSRCVHKAEDKGILKDQSYKTLLSDLGQLWRDTDAPLNARQNDGHWVHAFKEALQHMVTLGLCEPEPELVVPKKTGRPKKEKAADNTAKRPVGRPRIHPVEPDKPKRPRGRPRIHPLESDKPKRPRGRPRSHPIDLNKPKRSVGRPRKDVNQSSNVDNSSGA